MDPGWLFLIVCLTMMVLCFLMMGRRAGGGCLSWCLRQGRGARERDSREGDVGGEETEGRNKAEGPVASGRDTAPPVVPR